MSLEEEPTADDGWQASELHRLRSALPDGSTVSPYGSFDRGALDGWSDLDVEIALPVPSVELTDILDSGLWTWTIAEDDHAQIVRVVLVDGRRIDARVTGGRLRPPEAPQDRAARFDLVLAAARLGRGDRLIGVHLLLGVVRESLVWAMMLRDGDERTTHHPQGTARDELAADAVESLAAPGAVIGPDAAMRVAELYGRWRSELDTGYTPDWSGLEAVIARGRGAPAGR